MTLSKTISTFKVASLCVLFFLITSCGGGSESSSSSVTNPVANPNPVPGKSGALLVSNVLDRGAYLQLAPATVADTSQTPLQYLAYYSTSNNLDTVANIEKNGTPIGDYVSSLPSSSLPPWTTGKVNGALAFNGLDYIDAGNPAGLSFGTGDFTLEAWINPSAWVSSTSIIKKFGSSGYVLQIGIAGGTTNYVQLVIGNGTSLAYTASTAPYGTSGYFPNQWYHVVGVVDRTNHILQLYVNGRLETSQDITGFTGSIDTANSLTIGKQNINFQGIIDEVAIYGRALTPAEITARYNAGTGISVDPTMTGLAAGWRLDDGNGTTAADISANGYSGAVVNPPSTALPALGLDRSTTYYLNVIVKNAAGTKAAYTTATTTTLDMLPISFVENDISYNGFQMSVDDINNDGHIEPLGALNDGLGNLTADSYTSMGLSGIFSPGRVNRDCRVADFNGDGYPDVVCNDYSPEEVYGGSAPAQPQCEASSYAYNAASVAKLFINNGDGTFTEDPDFAALQIRGFGETILAADFNNDGYIDLYLPHYSFCSPNEHSWLLINNGHGKFTDVADAAGVALRNRPAYYQVEGLQALDFNKDGWIDFYAAGHFFMNNGCSGAGCTPTFTDQRAAFGLPNYFDEGIKFLDWNNDGNFDFLIHYPVTSFPDGTPGTQLYQFDPVANVFNLTNAIPGFTYLNSYGINAFDLNNDGREDIIIAGGTTSTSETNDAGGNGNTVVLLNYGTTFKLANTTPLVPHGDNDVAFGDFNGDGLPDVVKAQGNLGYYINQTAVPANNYFWIDIVGPNGERNQQGRVVTVQPQNHPSVIFTRAVDSGSGWMSQSQYDLLIGTPYLGAHTAKVYFASGPVTFTINPGDRKKVYPNGTVVNY